MKLILDNVPLGEVPGPVRRLGELFPRLVGVRLSSAGNGNQRWIDIEPIYMPLVRITRQAGQVFIEVNDYIKPRYYITLQGRRPFISVFRFDWKADDPMMDLGPVADVLYIKKGFELWK